MAVQIPFPISFWCGVPAEFMSADRYREIAEAGITVAQVSGTRESIIQQLNWCEDNGITGMVLDGRVHAGMSTKADWRETVCEVVADFAWHPAFWGYYLTDEPNAAQYPALGEITRAFDEADPQHPTYINLFPNYASEEQLGTPTYEEHIARYVEVVKPPLVSYDHYAIMEDGNDWPIFYPNLSVVRKYALEAGLDFWQIVLSLAFHECRDPSEADLRWQVWMTLAYGGKGISYFTYWTVTPDNFRNAIIDEFGYPTVHYPMVRRINKQIQNIGPVLMRLHSLGVWHSPVAYRNVQPKEDYVPQYVLGSSDVALTVGEFVDEGNAAIIVVNRSLERSLGAVVTLKPEFKTCREVSRTTGAVSGKVELSRTEAGANLHLSLAPGDGILYYLDR
jgi:hypothetical protein